MEPQAPLGRLLDPDYHDFGIEIHLPVSVHPMFLLGERIGAGFSGYEDAVVPQERISLSFWNPAIDFTHRLGRHTGTGGISRRIRLRMAANSFRVIATSAIWKQV